MQNFQTNISIHSSWKVWLAILTISLVAFIFNTSEFVPIGLLSLIANDFGISEAKLDF